MAYAVGDAGINLYFMSTLSFLLYFYTDFYGISAAVAAGIFFVARIVDAVTDPFMGYLADHTRSKWGRFRPYLAFGAIPLSRHFHRDIHDSRFQRNREDYLGVCHVRSVRRDLHDRDHSICCDDKRADG